MEHKLKILPEYFEAVKSGSKTFEVRKDDRGFQAGDILFLQEYENGCYTGSGLKVMVTYVLRDTEYCKEGYCIMGIKRKATNSKCQKCHYLVHNKEVIENEGNTL